MISDILNHPKYWISPSHLNQWLTYVLSSVEQEILEGNLTDSDAQRLSTKIEEKPCGELCLSVQTAPSRTYSQYIPESEWAYTEEAIDGNAR